MASTLLNDSDSDSDVLEMLAELSDWDSSGSSEEIASETDRSPTEPQEHTPEPQDHTPEPQDHEPEPQDHIPESQYYQRERLRPQKLDSKGRKSRRVNFLYSLDGEEFTLRFRMSKTVVEFVLKEIITFVKVTSSRNNGISPLHQLLLTLRYYALGTMLESVAEFIGCSKTSACRIVKDISQAIAKLYSKYVKLSPDTEQFYKIAGFPRVLGVIDCTHIRVRAPYHNIGNEFMNSNGNLSINVQAVCDADLKFTNVVARWPGATRDAVVFENSVLKGQCESGVYGNRWLLGDSAYPNRPYLLTPVKHPVSDYDMKYNEAHALTFRTIESTLEQWKRRFPVLALTQRVSLDSIQANIIATAVLHNICRTNNVVDVEPEVELPVCRDNVVTACEESEDFACRTHLINDYFKFT